MTHARRQKMRNRCLTIEKQLKSAQSLNITLREWARNWILKSFGIQTDNLRN